MMMTETSDKLESLFVHPLCQLAGLTVLTFLIGMCIFKINFRLFVFNLFKPPNSTVICIFFLLKWRVILKITPIWKNRLQLGPRGRSWTYQMSQSQG